MIDDAGSDPKDYVSQAIRRFELVDPLESGSALAKLVRFNRASEAYEKVNSIIFTVWDAIETFTGDAPDTESDPPMRGSRGFCAYMHDSKRWEIIQMQCNPTSAAGDESPFIDGG